MLKAKVKKPRKSYRELYNSLVPTSLCSTVVEGPSLNPTLVHIKFKGPISSTPALKNQKIKGTNILRNEAKVIFDIMTRAFQKSVNFKIPRFDEEVFCLIVCSKRRVSFDEDNVVTSIRDWLEPQFLRNVDRGWGVGIVTNDRFVSAYAVKKQKDAFEPDVTEIFLKTLKSVQVERDTFIESIVGVDAFLKKLY